MYNVYKLFLDVLIIDTNILIISLQSGFKLENSFSVITSITNVFFIYHHSILFHHLMNSSLYIVHYALYNVYKLFLDVLIIDTNILIISLQSGFKLENSFSVITSITNVFFIYHHSILFHHLMNSSLYIVHYALYNVYKLFLDVLIIDTNILIISLQSEFKLENSFSVITSITNVFFIYHHSILFHHLMNSSLYITHCTMFINCF